MGLALGEIQIEFSEYLPVMVRAFSPQRVWGGVTKPGVVTPGWDSAGPVARGLQPR
jgi:hypothetical protein